MMRLALIGRGRWGANIERTLKEMPGVEVVLVEKGSTAPPDISGVLIATPSATHADVAVPYIERGIPTFIEKPMATSISDAERIVQVARSKGTLVHVGHLHLYNPAFISLCSHVPRIGRIRFVHCVAMNQIRRTDSSILWDWLPHHVALMLVLMGRDPSSVQTWIMDENRFAATRFDYRDLQVLSEVAWESPSRRFSVSVFGDAGVLVYDDMAVEKLTLHEDGQTRSLSYAQERPLALELNAFVEAVRRTETDSTSLDLSLRVIRIIAAAERSTVTARKSPSVD